MTSSFRGRRRRSLRLSILDGMLHAAMVGASESFLGALAVELGHRGAALALLATVPLLAGAGAQLASPWLARRVGGPERLVVVGATVQALSHLGLLAVALIGTKSFYALLAAKLLFWVSGSLIGPAWGAWIAGLTRRIDRRRYLARRTGLVHTGLLLSFVGAGLFLARAEGDVLSRLAVLHVVAMVFRLGSAFALSRHEHARPAPQPELLVRGHLKDARFGVALFMAGVVFSVSVTSPFFTPYMLDELRLDYLGFTTLLAAAVLARALVAPLFGSLGQRSLLPLMLIGAIGVAATPALWVVAPDYRSLLVAQVISGAAWAAYELASFQLLIDSAREPVRLRFLAVAACLSTGSGVAGGLLGASALEWLGHAYRDLFLLGTVVRAAPLIAFAIYAAPRLRGVSQVMRAFIVRLETVRPGAGALARAVFPLPSRGPSDSTAEAGARDGHRREPS